MDLENVVLEFRDRIAVMTVNRPKAMNALDTRTLEEMGTALDRIEAQGSVRSVVLTGAGKAFVAGADIAQMSALGPMEARRFSRLGQALFDRIECFPVPVIAAVNGFALGGGCELAMACDIRIASDRAKLGQPEVNLGLIPGFAGTQRLTRLVGPGKAKELIFTADMVRAEEALAIGLVDRVFPGEELMDKALEMAGKIAAKGPNAVRLAKAAVNRYSGAALADGEAYESEAFGLCFATEEGPEGMKAFLEKRDPSWK